MEPASFT